MDRPGEREEVHKKTTGLRLGLAQIAPALGNVQVNLETHLSLLKEALRGRVDLLLFPELSLTGYYLRDNVPEVAVRLPDEHGLGASDEIRLFQEATREIDALVGLVIEDSRHRFYNASVYFSRGRIESIHRKVYLPTYGIFDESRFFAPGPSFRTFPVRGRNLLMEKFAAGTVICEDLWHPSAVGSLSRQGLDLLLVQCASPGRGVEPNDGRLGTERSYAHMLSVYAQLHTVFVAFCNRVGSEEGIPFWGGSRVLAPTGELLAPPAADDQALVICELDPFALRRARISNPLLRDERYDIQDADAAYARHLPAGR